MPSKVVDLGPVRDMVADWEAMRARIKAGSVKGYNITMCTEDGEELIFLGGIYKTDPMAALKAQLRMSGERMLTSPQVQDPPLRQSGT